MVKKVTLTKLKVHPLLLPWLKMRWEVGLRLLALETGIKEEGMVTRVGVVQDLQWVVIKVDSTQCLLRSARTRRTRQRRS